MTKEFAVRFLFSCLVDADVLDTRMHRFALDGPEIGPDLDAPTVLARFLERRSKFVADRLATSGPAPMDKLREDVFDAAISAAKLQPGLFRLTAPTGAAKPSPPRPSP
jgi:CRISPR-associated endonuclease/helicase Cas3